MSTNLRDVPSSRAWLASERLTQTRFWGGERGTCLQVTQRRPKSLGKPSSTDHFTCLQLTKEQARNLAAELTLFANDAEIEE